MKHCSSSFAFIIFVYINAFGQKTSTGLVPVSDLKTSYYKGFQGGLYPDGSNSRPVDHDSVGMVFSKRILPLDMSGNPDAIHGKIVLLSIGMSNTTQEFSFFKTVADTFKSKNPKLTIVDGAMGGQTAAIISDPSRNSNYWNTVDQKLQAAGVAAKQVLVCWIKEADANPSQPFPLYANVLSNELAAIARILRQRYPNCRLAFLSSRTYGGYATTTLNPEPYAYESGFSVKWLIERQIRGDTSLACTGQNPKAPWLAWGPYLWADGLNPRSDGMTWGVEDFVESDRTHPSAAGRRKVALALLEFFKTDATAKPWFLASGLTRVQPHAIETIPRDFHLYQNYPNPFNGSTLIRFFLPEARRIRLQVVDALGRETIALGEGQFPSGTHEVRFDASGLASGCYTVRLNAGNRVRTKTMSLVK